MPAEKNETYWQKSLRSITDWYNLQPAALKTIIFPVALASTGLLASIAATGENFGLAFFFAVLFVLVSLISALATRMNSESVHNVAAQRDEAIARIRLLDKIVSRKRDELRKIVLKSETEGPFATLHAATKNSNFSDAVVVLNDCLLESVSIYLRENGHLGNANIFLALLVPNLDDYLCPIVEPVKTGGTRRIPSVTVINTNDESSLAGKLWQAEDTNILCTNITRVSAEKGEFLFTSENERGLIKSVFVYRVDHPVSRERFAVWAVDADLEDVFPNRDDKSRIDDLIEIFDSYMRRLEMELGYESLIEVIAHILPVNP